MLGNEAHAISNRNTFHHLLKLKQKRIQGTTKAAVVKRHVLFVAIDLTRQLICSLFTTRTLKKETKIILPSVNTNKKNSYPMIRPEDVLLKRD